MDLIARRLVSADWMVGVFGDYGMQRPQEIEWFWSRFQADMPASVLEIGTGGAGLTPLLAFAGAKVITVDSIANEHYAWDSKQYREMCPDPDVTFINADSQDEQTRDAVLKSCPDGFDWVVIDGDHTLSGGQKDYDLYAPLAKKTIAIHDIAGYEKPTNPDWFPTVFWKQARDRFKTMEFVGVPSGGWGLIVLESVK